jgi:hypothetical protein
MGDRFQHGGEDLVPIAKDLDPVAFRRRDADEPLEPVAVAENCIGQRDHRCLRSAPVGRMGRAAALRGPAEPTASEATATAVVARTADTADEEKDYQDDEDDHQQ